MQRSPLLSISYQRDKTLFFKDSYLVDCIIAAIMNPLTSVLTILFASAGLIASFHINNINMHSSRYNAIISPLLMKELSPIDEMCIENVAEYCLHETCDIEEYEALVNQLEEQKDHFIRHVANVEALLHRLKNSNHPEYDPAEVSQLINDIKDTLAKSPTTLASSL